MRGATEGRTGRDELMREVRAALKEGRLTPADLRGLADERPEGRGRGPRATQTIEALGSAVVFLGIVLAYATAFGDMPDALQLTTPFVFPVLLLAGAAVAVHRGRPRWEVEAGTGLGIVSLAIALAASRAGAPGVAVDRWGLGAALIGGLVSAALLRWPPHPLMASLGLMGAVVAAANFGAHVLGTRDATAFRWLELGLAVLAALAGSLLVREHRVAASLPFAATAVLVAAACMMSLTGSDGAARGLSVWHVLLSLTVAAAIVMATALRMPAVMAAGVATAIMWLMLVIPLAGSSAAWAAAVVAMGIALLTVGLAGARIAARHPRR